jgi:ABC-type sugar transport system ATPase subunit
MSKVILEDLRKSFDETHVITGVDLEIADGEFVVFVGPSGSGKSTMLRMLAGLEQVTSGSIHIGEKDVTYESPSNRGIAMVFQSYALYPHMSVFENIAFNLRLKKVNNDEVEQRVKAAGRILKLTDLLDRKPAQLSGGQRQRVAIGRAIVRNPDVFLFDEPLSNLDAALRVEMRFEIERLHRELGATMVYVTHDQVEAMTLADRIVAFDSGKIQQVGSPIELYQRPSNLFVAGFIGSPKMNFISATSINRSLALAELGDKLQIAFDNYDLGEGNQLTLGIRPESVLLGEDIDSVENTTVIEGQIQTLEELGNISYAHVNTGAEMPIVVQLGADSHFKRGATVKLGLPHSKIHVFDAAGNLIEGKTQRRNEEDEKYEKAC